MNVICMLFISFFLVWVSKILVLNDSVCVSCSNCCWLVVCISSCGFLNRCSMCGLVMLFFCSIVLVLWLKLMLIVSLVRLVLNMLFSVCKVWISVEVVFWLVWLMLVWICRVRFGNWKLRLKLYSVNMDIRMICEVLCLI